MSTDVCDRMSGGANDKISFVPSKGSRGLMDTWGVSSDGFGARSGSGVIVFQLNETTRALSPSSSLLPAMNVAALLHDAPSDQPKRRLDKRPDHDNDRDSRDRDRARDWDPRDRDREKERDRQQLWNNRDLEQDRDQQRPRESHFSSIPFLLLISNVFRSCCSLRLFILCSAVCSPRRPWTLS